MARISQVPVSNQTECASTRVHVHERYGGGNEFMATMLVLQMNRSQHLQPGLILHRMWVYDLIRLQ